MHETAIDGDRNIEPDFLFTTMWSNLNVAQLVTCKQSEQIIWKQTWQFLADETMQTIPAASSTRIWELSIISF